jgi:hypothetical protein
MRFLSGLLACLSVGVSYLAYPNPPATVPAASTPEAAAVTPAPAAAPAAATNAQAASATPTAPEIDPREKYLLAKGYKIRMRGGVKMFCREEAILGSRVDKVQNCGTAQTLIERERNEKDAWEQYQRLSNMPKDTPGARTPGH